MKIYQKVCREVPELRQVICDCCGRPIPLDADYLSIHKTWGYASQKDGETTDLDICEACFDRWRATMHQQVSK